MHCRSGAQKSLMELLAHLDRDRFEPVLLHAEDAPWPGRPELAGVERVAAFRPTPLLEETRDRISRSLLRSGRAVAGGLRPVQDLRRALRRVQPDLVHTNTLKAHMLGGAAGRLAGLPLIWHVRDILEPGGARTWLLRAAAFSRPRIVAISDAVAAQFAGSGPPVTVVHNGLPLAGFTPGAPPPGLAVRARPGRRRPDPVHRRAPDALEGASGPARGPTCPRALSSASAPGGGR